MAITHGTLTLAADITAHAKPAAALAGAGAGLCTNGAHLVKVGFVTSTGVSTLSAASDAVTVVDNGADGKIAVTIVASSDSRVTSVNIYMTEAGGSNYYLAMNTANTSGAVNVSIADATLAAAAAAPTTDTGSAAGDSTITTSAGAGFEALYFHNPHATVTAEIMLSDTDIVTGASGNLQIKAGAVLALEGLTRAGTPITTVHARSASAGMLSYVAVTRT
ncbi:MAG: hypothetical protein ACOZEN_06825 [Thermodesulfobacteriota bacterium]